MVIHVYVHMTANGNKNTPYPCAVGEPCSVGGRGAHSSPPNDFQIEEGGRGGVGCCWPLPTLSHMWEKSDVSPGQWAGAGGDRL